MISPHQKIWIISGLLFCKIFISKSSEDCQQLEGIEAERCCARAEYKIADSTFRSVINQTIYDANGDKSLAFSVKHCLEAKKNISSTVCSGVDYPRDHLFCSNSPFTTEMKLQSIGAIPDNSISATSNSTFSCDDRRFLLWERNIEDYPAGHSHKTFSLSCALWEAYSLNRTLIWDSFVSIVGVHSNLDFFVEVPFSYWYNRDSFIKAPNDVLFWHEFLDTCGYDFITEDTSKVAVVSSQTSHAELLSKSNIPLVIRSWTGEPVKYGFNVCHQSEEHREKGVDYNMPNVYSYIQYAPWVGAAVYSIMESLSSQINNDGSLICIHVRRGDKLKLKDRYPNLEEETSPKHILELLRELQPPGSPVYIATNEPDPNSFFASIGDEYQLFTIYSFPEIINAEKFITSSLALVDYTIIGRCHKYIPTFRSEDSRGFGESISLSDSEK